MIPVGCPRCGHRFAVEYEMRGRADRCPTCATPVPVPADVPAVARTGTAVVIPPYDPAARADFDRYLDTLAGAITRSEVFAPAGPGADLVVTVILDGGRAGFDLAVTPADASPDAAGVAGLSAALFAVPVPAARGGARAALAFAVRGGAGR
jgi:hypothetical protein